MLNNDNIKGFEKKLMDTLEFLSGSEQKEIKLRDKSSKSYEFKGTPKEFIDYINEKY